MTQRATAIARKLNTILKNASVMVAPHGDFEPQLMHGTVITVTDGVAQGITLTVYCRDSYEIGTLATQLFKQANKATFPLDAEPGVANEVHLHFSKMTPVLDKDDVHLGEALVFTPVECSYELEDS